MNDHLEKALEIHREKLQHIKLFLSDADGVLTDGRIYWAGDERKFNRFFHISDGYGMRILKQAGIKIGVISGGNSQGLHQWSHYMKLDFLKTGNEDKRQGYLDILNSWEGLKDEDIAYVGDEFFDLPLLRRVGFSATPPHASKEVKQSCHYVTTRPAGQGCIREVVELIRMAQNIVPSIPDFPL